MPVGAVVDVDAAEGGLQVCYPALVGAVQRDRALVDDGAMADGCGGLGSFDRRGRGRSGRRGGRLLLLRPLDGAVGLDATGAVDEATGASTDGAVLVAGEAGRRLFGLWSADERMKESMSTTETYETRESSAEEREQEQVREVAGERWGLGSVWGGSAWSRRGTRRSRKRCP